MRDNLFVSFGMSSLAHLLNLRRFNFINNEIHHVSRAHQCPLPFLVTYEQLFRLLLENNFLKLEWLAHVHFGFEKVSDIFVESFVSFLSNGYTFVCTFDIFHQILEFEQAVLSLGFFLASLHLFSDLDMPVKHLLQLYALVLLVLHPDDLLQLMVSAVLLGVLYKRLALRAQKSVLVDERFSSNNHLLFWHVLG